MFFSQIDLFGQNDCVVYFETNTAGDTYVNIDVKANDFTDVLGFQMYIKWDSTVMVRDTVVYSNPDLQGISFGQGDLGADIMSSNWFSNLGVGKTFDDGTVLFTVRYTYTGDPCDETTIDLIDVDQYHKNLITYGYDEETEYPLNSTPSTIMIPGDNCNGGGNNTGVGFSIDDAIGGDGTEVCIPIRVDSFVNIGALNFKVCYDNSHISFIQSSHNTLLDMGGNVVENNIGDSVYVFVFDDVVLRTIEDDSILIELCFLVSGDNGDVSCLEFCEVDVTGEDSNVSLPYYTNGGCLTVGDIDNAVKFIASDEEPDKDDGSVCVDITSENFNNIETFQYIVEWDAPIMTWKGLGDVNNIGITDGPSGNIKLVDGTFNGKKRLKISWNSPVGKTVADGDILYQLCFDLAGDCDESTDVDIIGDPPGFPIEVTSDDVILPHVEVPGSVKINCGIYITAVNIDSIECNGGSGSIYITVSGDPNDYKFKWVNSSGVQISSTQNLLGVDAGTYTVTVTSKSNSNNSTTQTYTIIEPEPLKVQNSTVTDVTCETDGAISITVTGETDPYTYAWSLASIGDHPIATNLQADSYTVSITDSKGCETITRTYTVGNLIPDLKASGEMQNITCKDANNGSISVAVSGGCEPYTYEWSDGIAGDSFRDNLAAGDYTVTITDKKGNTTTISYTITNPDSPLSVVGATVEPDAINVDVTGGETPYTYSWTGPNGFTSDQEDLTGLEPGTYTLEVTDNRGCVVDGNSWELIGVIDPISVVVKVNTKLYNGFGVACNGDCNGQISADIIANVPWKVYLDGQEITLPYNNVCGGEHVLKIVDNANKEVSDTFTVEEPDPLEISVDSVSCVNEGKEDGSISISISGGVPDYEIDWGITGETDPTIENLPKGTYSVAVSDLNNCTALSEEIKVKSCDKSDCYTGSIIMTPNGDEFNEYFLVKCYDDFESNELHVYDRVGNEVYSQNNYDGTWNGVDKNGNELTEDSYMWVFIGVNEAGVSNVYRGTVTILRK